MANAAQQLKTVEASEAQPQVPETTKASEATEAKGLVTQTVDALGTKEFSSEVDIDGQKVFLPLEQTLTPSARFTDLESKLVQAEEAGAVARIDKDRIVTDSAAVTKEMEAIRAETKKEVSDMAQFLELLRAHPSNYKIINKEARVRFPDQTVQDQTVEAFMLNHGVHTKDADLVLLSNHTNIDEYLNLTRYGFDVEKLQAGTTGSGETTGVQLSYTLHDGKKETIVIAFTNTGKPKNDVAQQPIVLQEGKVLDFQAAKEAQEKAKAEAEADKTKGLV